MPHNHIEYGQSFEAYRKAHGLNKSSIDKILKCPAEYHELTMLPEPEQTPAMRFGTALHSLVLEPDSFTETVHVLTRPATTKEGKAQKKEAEDKGQICISQEDYERMFRMRGHMLRHPRIRHLLPHVECAVTNGIQSLPGHSEVSVYWEMETPEGLVECKARVDRLCTLPSGDVIAVDLKTTSGGLDKDSIAKHVATYGYHRQCAWYSEGLQRCGLHVASFIFIFTSTTPPYLCVPVTLDYRAEMLGLEECKLAAEAYAQGVATDEWPGYSDEIYELDMPEWAYRRSPVQLPTMYD